MVRLIGLLAFGVIVGGISAGASLLLQQKLHPVEVAKSEADKSITDPHTPIPEATHASPAEALHAENAALKGSATETLPVPIRPRGMSVEELLRYGMGVKEREQQVRQQEDLLQQRRIQQQLALTDIEGERREIDGLRVQIADQLKAAEKLIERLQEARQAVLEEKQAASAELSRMKESRIDLDGAHADNTKRLSQWLQGMEAEKAAGVLKEMANDGKIDMAVQILANFEAREAAKILSAIDDPKLIQQFAEKYQHVKSASKETTKR